MTWWDTYRGKGKFQLLSYGTINSQCKNKSTHKIAIFETGKKLSSEQNLIFLECIYFCFDLSKRTNTNLLCTLSNHQQLPTVITFTILPWEGNVWLTFTTTPLLIIATKLLVFLFQP